MMNLWFIMSYPAVLNFFSHRIRGSVRKQLTICAFRRLNESARLFSGKVDAIKMLSCRAAHAHTSPITINVTLHYNVLLLSNNGIKWILF